MKKRSDELLEKIGYRKSEDNSLNKSRSDELLDRIGYTRPASREPAATPATPAKKAEGPTILPGSALDEMIKERDAFETEKGYSKYRYASDFKKNSAVTGSKGDKKFYLFDRSTWKKKGDDLYDFINDIDGYREHYAATQGGPAQSYNDYEDYAMMNSDEIDMYNYLYNKQGQDKANQYLSDIRSMLGERKYEAREKELNRMAEENPVAMSLLSVPTAMVGGVVSAVDLAAQNLERLTKGEPVSYYSSGQRAGAAAQILRDAVGKEIEDNTDFTIAGKNVGRFVYDTAMSGADSLAAGALGGGSAKGLKAVLQPGMGGALLGINAATSTARDIAARGGNDRQALIGGIAAGVAESFFENYSIGNFKKLKDVPVATFKDFALNIAKSMGVNATEEAATEAANLVVDRINMGDLSTWNTVMEDFEAQGMDRNEARRQTIKVIAGQIAEAAASGALMGFGFGGIGSASSAAASRSIGSQIQDVDPLRQAAMEMQGSDSQQLAQKIGEEPSRMQKGALLRTLAEDTAARYMEQGMAEGEARQKAADDVFALLEPKKAEVPVQAQQTEDVDVKPTEAPVRAADVKTNINASPAPVVQDRGVATMQKAVYNDSGAEVEIEGISSVENGQVYVQLSDGGTADVDDISFDDPEIDQLYAQAADFDTDTAKAFIAGYEGGSVSNYLKGFKSMQGSAKAGLTYEQASESVYTQEYLTENGRQYAYAAGQRAAAPQQTGSGVIRKFSGTLSTSQSQALKGIDAVAKAINRKVNIVDTIPVTDAKGSIVKGAVNAYFDPSTNEYYIALDGVGEAYSFFALHESIHDIAANNELGYASLEEIVFDVLKEQGADIDALMEVQKNLYPNESEAYWREEIVANTVPAILTDKATADMFIERIIGADADTRTVFERILDSILDFLQKAYDVLKGEKSWQQMELVKQNQDAIERIRDAYFAALEDLQGQDTEQGEGVRLSAKDNESLTIKKQIAQYQDELNGMDPVANLDSEPRPRRNNKPDRTLMRKALQKFYGSLEYRVDRKGFGVVQFDENALGEVVRYIRSDAEFAAAKAAPAIVKRGIQIDHHTEHKDRGKTESYTFAAPVVLNGKRGNAAVVVQFTNRNKPHCVRILMPDGSGFNLDAIEKSSQTDSAATENGSRQQHIGSASTDSIADRKAENKRKFSMRDSEGNTLTEQQAEYFKDSKVRDAEGNLKVVYHGSPEDFTQFSLDYLGANGTAEGYGFYFTDQKSIAEGYSQGREGQRNPENTGSLFEVYLDIKKPLSDERVTMSRAEFKKFIREMDKQVDEDGEPLEFLANYGDVSFEGLNAVVNTVMETEYDGSSSDVNMIHSIINGSGSMETVFKVLRETTGYDGIIVENPTWGGEQTIYITFHPEQIKNVTNKTPTTDPDIRFSLNDTASVSTATLESELAKKDKVIADLKAQFKLTEGHRVSDKAINKLAGKILKEYSSSYDRETLVENLRTMFDYIANTEQPVWDEVFKQGMGMAKKIVRDSAELDTELYRYYAKAREYLRTTRIKMTSVQRAEAAYLMGSYRNYRQALFGSVNLMNSGIYLDSAWGEIGQIYPELFKSDTNEGDMVDELLAIVSIIKPVYRNPYGYDMDGVAYDLFLRIYDEYFDMPEVKTFADKKAAELAKVKARYSNRIAQIRQESKARYEEKLKKLRAENVAKRQELSRKYKEALAKQHKADIQRYREQYKMLSDRKNEQLMNQKAAFQAWKEKDRMRSDVRKYQQRIEKKAKDLSAWLLRPTDKKHVPESLRNEVSKFLETLEFTGSAKAAEWRYRMEKLAAFMEKLDNAEGETIYLDLEDSFAEAVRNIAKTGGNLATMDVEQLKELDTVLGQLKKAVQEVNTILVNGRRQELSDYGDEVIAKADAKGPKYGGNNAVAKLLSSGNIKPVYFFKNLGGPMQKLFNEIREAQNKVAFGAQAAKAFYEKAAAKHNLSRWKDDTLKMRTERGNTIELTRQQAMSLYAIYKRELANKDATGAAHLSKGGFVYADEQTKERTGKLGIKTKTTFKDAKPKPLSPADMAKISGWLTTDQKAFADELVEYMSTTMAGIGNTTSMKISGYKKFAEGYYFPYKSSRAFLNTQAGTAGQDNNNRWKNWGSAKATQAGANNPIVLQDFTEVWADHVNEMLMYAHMSIPQENLLKVFNYRTRVTDEETSQSVKAAIQNAYGEAAMKYIDTLLADLGGNVLADPRDNFGSKLTSRFKKGAVLASLSVAIQQPSAIVRAMALVDPKYFVTTAKKGSYDEAMKYAGTAVIKRIGGFDTGTGHGMADWITELDPEKKVKAFFDRKDSSFRDKVLGWAPGKMDEITWGHLWEAVKNEVAAEKHLKPGTAEHLEAAGKRFNDVVEYTQVYDSTISRSELMRSKSAAAQMATAFMAEPVTAYNMLYDAFVNKTGVSKKRALCAFIGTTVFNALLKSIVYALRDDDDQAYPEKYVEAVTDSLLGGKAEKISWLYGLGSDLNPINLIPYARDIASIMQGYDVERADMALIGDFVGSLEIVFNDNKTIGEKIRSIAEAISAFFGIPLKNVLRDTEAIYDSAKQYVFGDSNFEVTERGIQKAIRSGLGSEDTVKAHVENLYSAYEKGNTRRLQRSINEISGQYTDKVDKLIREGKTRQEAEKSARSSILTSCTNVLKPYYLSAPTIAEKMEIRSLALRIKIGNRQLYAGYDFDQHWK